jgi:hypothetical protein
MTQRSIARLSHVPGAALMIDNQEKTQFLIDALKEVAPIPAHITPELARELSKEAPAGIIPTECNVVEIFYMGDYGGISCGLEFAGPDANTKHVVSITHLRFNRNTPFFREIDAYQRHRSKKLKKQRGRTDG